MRVQDVFIKLLLERPFFGTIATLLTPVETDKVTTIQMTALPSMKLTYNPIWFDSLPPGHQMGVVMHELLHVLLLHPFRKGERDENIWAIACDMAVNEYLEPYLLWQEAMTVEKISEAIKLELPRKKTAEAYYDYITDHDKQVAFVGRDDDILIIMDDQQHLTANKMSDEKPSELDKNALKYQLSSCIEETQLEGGIPEGLAPILEEVYDDLKINWRNVLKRFLTGRGKIQIRKSYKRQSRRYDNLPGTKRAIGVRALVAIDESGSISDGYIAKFYQELQEINKITGASIQVVRFDTDCSEPVPLTEFMKLKGRMKRGGTDFRPIFKMADQLKINLLIIFTDGDGEAPVTVNQKTLWVITKNGHTPADFGHTVYFEA